MSKQARRGVLVRMFSSALASQALLSATSFSVGLLLIRGTSDLQYGYYVLVSGVLILAASLQYSFIAPAMVNRMERLSAVECGDLTGGLYREQRAVMTAIAGLALAVTVVLWAGGVFDSHSLLLVLAAIGATAAALRREYFRMVLLAYRRAYDVLRGDFIYCLLLLAGVLLATSSTITASAAAAVVATALAALIAGISLSRILRHREPWNTQGAPGILRAIAPLGAWSTAGAAIHWSFSQGYTFLVAATLDVGAIAAIAAIRLLAMPVNLLSTGIGSLMLPMTSRWLQKNDTASVLRRLLGFALGMAGVAVCYFAALWLLRDWIFAVVLKKQFVQADLLLMLWAASFLLMVVRQQLLNLLIVRERFRLLTPLGLVCAVLGLACSYVGIQHFGGAGAVMGILIGEFINTSGIVVLCLREVMLEKAPHLPPLAATP